MIVPRALSDGKQTKPPRNVVIAAFVGACLEALVEAPEFRYYTSYYVLAGEPRGAAVTNVAPSSDRELTAARARFTNATRIRHFQDSWRLALGGLCGVITARLGTHRSPSCHSRLASPRRYQQNSPSRYANFWH